MSSRCIVTSPAQLVDEYAELPIKIVLNPNARAIWCCPALKPIAALGLTIVTLFTSFAYAQNTTASNLIISDMLIMLDTDGRSHTVQHTLATDGAAVKLQLPGSVIPQEILFFGPERDRFTTQYKNNPSIVALSSGSAFARYQHQYGTEVQQIQPGHFVLSTTSVPANIEINGALLSQSSISWVFPNEFEVVSYTVTDYNAGRWVSVNNMLTFHVIASKQVDLSISYIKKANTLPDTLAIDKPACHDINTPTDACAEDLDEDGIPDYRDVCISSLGQITSTFGCAHNQPMALHDIEFKTGRTYLDVTARILLDKVAHAILKSDHTFYEVGAHSDNEGSTQSNLQLSQKRADAVRHYLMLKGVNPNVLRASGYGEKYPVRDNSIAEGRRANRRIELVIVD